MQSPCLFAGGEGGSGGGGKPFCQDGKFDTGRVAGVEGKAGGVIAAQGKRLVVNSLYHHHLHETGACGVGGGGVRRWKRMGE